MIDQRGVDLGSPSAGGIGGCAVQVSPKSSGLAIAGVRDLRLETISAVSCALDATEAGQFKVISFGVCLPLAGGHFCSAGRGAALTRAKISGSNT